MPIVSKSSTQKKQGISNSPNQGHCIYCICVMTLIWVAIYNGYISKSITFTNDIPKCKYNLFPLPIFYFVRYITNYCDDNFFVVRLTLLTLEVENFSESWDISYQWIALPIIISFMLGVQILPKINNIDKLVLRNVVSVCIVKEFLV